MKVLANIKSLNELYIDLVDSNQAMIVLNNLPNVQLLNGRNTKDDDDEEEEDNGGEGVYDDNYELNHRTIPSAGLNINNLYNNEINNRNNSNHLIPQMEKYEENKNLETNISDGNNNNYSNEIDEINKKNLNLLGKNNENDANENKKTKIKITAGEQYKINLNKDTQIKPNNGINNFNEIKEQNKSKKEGKETNIDLSKNNKGNFVIDVTKEELNLLKGEKYDEKSNFTLLTKEFYDLITNQEETSDDGLTIQNNYINKLKKIEEKKKDLPNYYYFFLLYKKKIKMIQNMYKEVFPYIINKCPELNKDNIISRLNNELFSSIKDIQQLMNLLHSHVDGITENLINYNCSNNLAELVKEKDQKIIALEQLKNKLLLNYEQEKAEHEKKVSILEKENKIMTEKILTRIDSLSSPLFLESPQATSPLSKRCVTLTKLNSSSQNKKQIFNDGILNTNFVNHYYPSNKTRSPNNYSEYINTIDYNNTNYLNVNANNNRQQLLSLRTLKEFINELYISKAQYDIKCTELKLPKETLEEYMYTFLNKKYGLKNLIIEWAKNIIAGIKYYSKKDSIVLLFGKIMRNEQEEDARFIIQKVYDSIEELLLYYIKRQNPMKLVNDIRKIFERKKKIGII